MNVMFDRLSSVSVRVCVLSSVLLPACGGRIYWPLRVRCVGALLVQFLFDFCSCVRVMKLSVLILLVGDLFNLPKLPRSYTD